MLGTCRKQEIISDIDGGKYADILFGGIKGEIAYCRKSGKFMSHTFYRASGIVKAPFVGAQDCYMSMNTFFKNSRKTENLKRLCNLYVDLDIYKSVYKDMPKEGIIQILRDEYIGKLIPEPTFIIDSGNGMYLVWHLNNEDKKALPRYLAAEKYLIDTLSEFGADGACKDASRILRVPGTINGKCGKTVRIMDYTGVAYTLYEIMREYEIKPLKTVYTSRNRGTTYPYGTATEQMRILAAKIAEEMNVGLPDFEDYQETFDFIRVNLPTHGEDEKKKPLRKLGKKIIQFADIRAKKFLLKEYITDIETLILSREGEDCKREYALFLYRLFIQEATGDAGYALQKTLELNGKLSCPFSDAYVKIRTKSAQKKIDSGDTYHYKKSTIIKALDISVEEMQSLDLCVLTNFTNEKERKARSNRRAYEKRLAEQGKDTKKNTIEKRREQIAAMLKQGQSPEQIMEALSISKATYYRDIAAINIAECVEVCVEACTQVTKEVTKNVVSTVKNCVEAVKKAISGDSQKISPTIIMNSVGVPHDFIPPVSGGAGDENGAVEAQPPPVLA